MKNALLISFLADIENDLNESIINSNPLEKADKNILLALRKIDLLKYNLSTPKNTPLKTEIN